MQNMGVSQQTWIYEIIGGMLLMCQNTAMRVYGTWIKTYYVLCSKHKAPLAMCYNPPLVRDMPLGALAYVKVVYQMSQTVTLFD